MNIYCDHCGNRPTDCSCFEVLAYPPHSPDDYYTTTLPSGATVRTPLPPPPPVPDDSAQTTLPSGIVVKVVRHHDLGPPFRVHIILSDGCTQEDVRDTRYQEDDGLAAAIEWREAIHEIVPTERQGLLSSMSHMSQLDHQGRLKMGSERLAAYWNHRFSILVSQVVEAERRGDRRVAERYKKLFLDWLAVFFTLEEATDHLERGMSSVRHGIAPFPRGTPLSTNKVRDKLRYFEKASSRDYDHDPGAERRKRILHALYFGTMPDPSETTPTPEAPLEAATDPDDASD